MNPSMQKLLLFLGGVAVGAFAASTLRDQKSGVRPALAGAMAGAMNVRDKAMGALERTREDVSDFMAEVENVRVNKEENTKAEG